MAFSSDLDICNMALSHLGRTATPIQSFSERSTEAALCKRWYDPARREVLEVQDWSFARKRVSLALHADLPPDEWAFRYQKPSDCIAIRSFWNPFSNTFVAVSPIIGVWPGFGGDLTTAIPYETEASLDGQQTTILTNQESAVIRYTYDATLTQLFPPLFVNALSYYLAAKMALGVTGKKSIRDDMTNDFKGALRSGSASDANQRTEPPPRDGSSVRARL